jgi:hypothetical protein
MPIAADGQYTFTLDLGAKRYETPVRLARTTIVSPAAGAVVKFQSPFVVEWDRELQGEVQVWLNGCMYYENIATTPTSATLEDVTFTNNTTPCHTEAGINVWSDVPLELGPFPTGMLHTETFAAQAIQFDITR